MRRNRLQSGGCAFLLGLVLAGCSSKSAAPPEQAASAPDDDSSPASEANAPQAAAPTTGQAPVAAGGGSTAAAASQTSPGESTASSAQPGAATLPVGVAPGGFGAPPTAVAPGGFGAPPAPASPAQPAAPASAPSTAATAALPADATPLQRAWRDLFGEPMSPAATMAAGSFGVAPSNGESSLDGAWQTLFATTTAESGTNPPRSPLVNRLVASYKQALDREAARLKQEAGDLLASDKIVRANFPDKLKLLKKRLEDDRDVVRKGRFDRNVDEPIRRWDGDKLVGVVFRDSRMKRKHIGEYAAAINRLEKVIKEFKTEDFETALARCSEADLPAPHTKTLQDMLYLLEQNEAVLKASSPKRLRIYMRLRNIKLHEVGYLEFSGKPQSVRLVCDQVIGPEDMLVYPNYAGTRYDRIWITGHPTTGMTDGQLVKIEGCFAVTGTKTYESVGAGTRTVFVVEPFDVEKYLNNN